MIDRGQAPPSTPTNARRIAALAGVLFGLAAYPVVWLLAGRPSVPGRVGGLLLLLYAALLGLLALLSYLHEAILPEFPALVAEWTEPLGIAPYDHRGLFAAAAATVVCLIVAPALAVVPLLLGGAFVCLLGLRAAPRPTDEVRSLYRPPDVPDEVLTEPRPDGASPESGRVEVVGYAWRVEWAPGEAAALAMQLAIALARLEAFRSKNPYREGAPAVWDYDEFVKRGITGEVLEAARKFQEETEKRGWTPFHEVCSVLAFVQALPYARDMDSMGREDYWRYPIETLHDRQGDCEDSSILAAAVLRAMGHEVVILEIPPHGDVTAHLAIGVAATEGFPVRDRLVQGRYLYCETTATGWRVGDIPPEMTGCPIEVRAV